MVYQTYSQIVWEKYTLRETETEMKRHRERHRELTEYKK